MVARSAAGREVAKWLLVAVSRTNLRARKFLSRTRAAFFDSEWQLAFLCHTGLFADTVVPPGINVATWQ
jgi:hypothetical protein